MITLEIKFLPSRDSWARKELHGGFTAACRGGEPQGVFLSPPEVSPLQLLTVQKRERRDSPRLKLFWTSLLTFVFFAV